MKRSAKFVFIAALAQLAGLASVVIGPESNVMWLIASSVGAIFLTLIGIWWLLAMQITRQQEADRTRKAFDLGRAERHTR